MFGGHNDSTLPDSQLCATFSPVTPPPFYFTSAIYMWYPIAGPSPIAVHGPISGPKDRYRAVDRYRARSYRSKRLELRFAVAVHSPIAVHGSITVQPEFFKFPRRNVPLGISQH